MREILELNKKKIIKVYFWSAGVLSGIFLIFLYFHREISIKWISLLLILTSIVFPIFLIAAFMFECYNKRRILKKITAEKPYSQLKHIGFDKWTLMDDAFYVINIPYAEIDGIQILFDIDTRHPNIVKFIINCNTFNLNRRQFLEKSAELKPKNIDINFYTLTKRINIKNEKITIREIEMEIKELIHVFQTNKFKLIPIPDSNQS